jgi:hypothetical protein
MIKVGFQRGNVLLLSLIAITVLGLLSLSIFSSALLESKSYSNYLTSQESDYKLENCIHYYSGLLKNRHIGPLPIHDKFSNTPIRQPINWWMKNALLCGKNYIIIENISHDNELDINYYKLSGINSLRQTQTNWLGLKDNK